MYPPAFNLDRGLELGVAHVKVRYAMLVVVHDDHEALETAKFGHATTSREPAKSSSPIPRAEAQIHARAISAELASHTFPIAELHADSPIRSSSARYA